MSEQQTEQKQQLKPEDTVLIIDGKLTQAFQACLDLALKQAGLQANEAVSALQKGTLVLPKDKLEKALQASAAPSEKVSKSAKAKKSSKVKKSK